MLPILLLFLLLWSFILHIIPHLYSGFLHPSHAILHPVSSTIHSDFPNVHLPSSIPPPSLFHPSPFILDSFFILHPPPINLLYFQSYLLRPSNSVTMLHVSFFLLYPPSFIYYPLSSSIFPNPPLVSSHILYPPSSILYRPSPILNSSSTHLHPSSFIAFSSLSILTSPSHPSQLILHTLPPLSIIHSSSSISYSPFLFFPILHLSSSVLSPSPAPN